MHRFIHNLAVVLLCAVFAGNATAQVDREALIQRIVAAQGLLEMFDQQMTHQRDATRAYAATMLEEGVRQAGGSASAKEQAAFERLVSRAAAVFTAQELVGAWSAEYGKELSLRDLNEILRYYESPVGQKDVAASKAALARFSHWAAQEGQARTSSLIADFAAELKAARQ